MNRKNAFIPLLFLILSMAFFTSFARAKSSPLSLFAKKGFVLLHPYFNDKSWKISAQNIDIILPDTFQSSQGLEPLSFDIGKNVDNTVAVFTTAQGDLFLMNAVFTPYFGFCQNGEIAFNIPQKITLSGISLNTNTPIYLLKDMPVLDDSMRIVIGTSSSFLYAAMVKVSTASIVKIDTLQMQGASSIVRIMGNYSESAQRDTAIWAIGANGVIRSFPVNQNAFGQERKWDIAGLSDTVKCIGGSYAGTSAGKIYVKNASQSFSLENAGAGKAINAIYPRGAIGAQGNFIEHAGASWRSTSLGTSNFQYANFILTSGGFGVELLDSKWNYESHIYRDSSSKILITYPIDKFTYVNFGPWKYSSPYDTGVSIYILDPDSNYSDFAMSLKTSQTSILLNSDGVNVFSPVPDTETCHVGIAKFRDGIINLSLRPLSFTITINSDLRTQRIDCGTCYWKKYDFIITKSWNFGDTVIIKAGKDDFKIENANNSVTIASNHKMPRTDEQNIKCRIAGNRLLFTTSIPDIKNISFFDASGRKFLSIAGSMRPSIIIPSLSYHGIIFIEMTFENNATQKMALPLIH